MGKHFQAERGDVYSRITADIVAAIETGAGEWRMPWRHDGTAIARPQSAGSHRRYRGMNVLALWIAATANGFGSGLWGTYRQWQGLGAQVRKGERGATVVLWKEASRSNDSGEYDDADDRPRFFARAFTVFNLSQVDGYESEAVAEIPNAARLSRVDAFFDALGIACESGAYDACYKIDEDRIHMPPFASFRDAPSYAGTLLHEAAHATGAKHRLDRQLGQRFRRDAVAMEEIVAELTASFVLADLGVACEPRHDHAAYVASWLRALKNDPRAIFVAAGKAQQAADWMHARQPGATAPAQGAADGE